MNLNARGGYRRPGLVSGHGEAGLTTIYKVCDAGAWQDAVRIGVYGGSADDRRDGFIHFSTAGQLAETLQKHFAGQDGLRLIAVAADRLGEGLRWERSRGGELFPHLYGSLDVHKVLKVADLPLQADGTHAIPEVLS